jgi:hypothetical protein
MKYDTFPPPLGNQFSGSHVTSGNQGFSSPQKTLACEVEAGIAVIR